MNKIQSLKRGFYESLFICFLVSISVLYLTLSLTQAKVSTCRLGAEFLVGRNAGDNQRFSINQWDVSSSQISQLDSYGELWGDSRSASAAAFGDVDGDGLEEFLVGRNEGGNERFALYRWNDATDMIEQMGFGGEGWGDSRETTAVAFGDVDGDGNDEFAVGRFDTAFIFSGEPGMRFGLYRWNGAVIEEMDVGGQGWGDSRGATAIAFGDVDGDGKHEFVVGRNVGGNQRFALYRWNGSEIEQMGTGGEGWGDSRGTTAVAFGDVDGDGKDEFLVGRNAGGNQRFALYRWNGSEIEEMATGGEGWGDSRGTTAVAFGDVDGDGKHEFAVGRRDTALFPGEAGMRFGLYRWNGTQIEEMDSGGTDWGSSRYPTAIAFGDIGDGRDVFLVGRNEGSNHRFALYRWDPSVLKIRQVGTAGEGWGDSRGVNAVAFSNLIDTDRDGLSDVLETFGLDATCDGDSTPDLDLAALGANPQRKDLFLELDCLVNDVNNNGILEAADHTHCPLQNAVEDVVTAFAIAPVNNPDGTIGIQLHIDVGPLYGMGAVTNINGIFGAVGNYGDFGGGGDQITEAGNTIVDWDGATGNPGTDIDTLKNANFAPIREGIFRYGLFAHQTNIGSAINDCTSGWARRPGNRFMVTLGGIGDPDGDGVNARCWAGDANGFSVGNENQQAGTLMHEFGHTLGLMHNGAPPANGQLNYKPNYLSVMRYGFQMCRVPAHPVLTGLFPGGCDFSRIVLPITPLANPPGLRALDESNLDECLGIEFDGPRDWDGDGNIEGVTNCQPPFNTNIPPTDINVGSAITSPSNTDLLEGFNDWPNLIYGLASVVPGTAAGAEPVGSELVVDEADPQVIENDQQALIESSKPEIGITLTGPPTVLPGDTYNVNAVLKSQGRGTAYEVNASLNSPFGDQDQLNIPLFKLLDEDATLQVEPTVPENACSQDLNHELSVTFKGFLGESYAINSSVTVAVLDMVPPELILEVTPDALWPPNHKLIDIAVTVGVTDTCDPNPSVELVSISSNEPDNGLGDGDTANDIQEASLGTDDRNFKLRAERSGTGDGRIYTIVYQAKDASGNTTTKQVEVFVPGNFQ